MPEYPEQPDRLAVLIPAYRPSGGLVDLIRSLHEQAAPAIVIVDDGSGPEFRDVFARAAEFPKVQVLRHAVNLGKGAALKTAFNYVLCAFPNLTGVVTADADGQHHPEDIQRVADALKAQPDSLILGSRSFDRDVPLRSKFGNVATRGIMHALLGQKLTDTQTGLRGIPAGFLHKLLRHEATGYEFELEMLIAAHELSIPIVEVPIRTIYEAGNKSSHFNPIIDSMKIYFVLLRFGSVSIMSGLLDSLVYILVWSRTQNLLASQVVGRVVSVCFNYTMVRSSVFYSHQRHKTVLPKYLLLVLVSGTASYGGIQYLHQRLGVAPITAKLVVETILFFVNFAVQRLFIFKPQESAGEPRTAPYLIFSSALAVAFVSLLGVEIYGLFTSNLFAQEIWHPIGLTRFLRFGGAFLALAVPLLVLVPWTFAAFIAALLLVLTAVSVGLQPLLAAGFFLISCSALGARLLGPKSFAEKPGTGVAATHVCATLLGAGVYVFLMTLVARLPVNYPAAWGILLAIPIVLDPRGVWRRLTYWAYRLRRLELRSGWERAAFALLVFLLMAHWLVALKPETSADGLAMHLAVCMDMAAHHRITFEPGRFLWSVMPMGADWAYSILYLLGGEYAPRIFNFAMLLAVITMLYAASRRWLSSAASFLVAASFAATPVVQFVTGSLFVENFLAAVVIGMVTAVWRFGETGDRKLLFLAMALGGTAVTTKYGAIVFLALALPLVLSEIVSRWHSLGRKPLAVCALSLVILLVTALPTYAIAYGMTGNPIFPFLNPRIHSPLVDPKADFTDARFHIPTDWGTLYSLTFYTSRSYEGQDGTFGFQYLIVVPLVLLGLLVVESRAARTAGIIALGGGLLVFLATPNVRYLYTALPLLLVSFAGLLGWVRTNQRWIYRVLIGYLFACTALNTYFMAGSSYYHKDFCLRLPFSRAERERYKWEAAPMRAVVEWYDQRHANSAVLLADDSEIAGLTGRVFENHWHQYPTVAALRGAATLPDMLRLMRGWKVEYLIAHKPSPRAEVHPALLRQVLENCTLPEYEYGDVYVARLQAECSQSQEHPAITVGRGFYDDFDPALGFRGDWERDSHFDAPDLHTISYTDVPGAEVSIAFEGTKLTYVFTKAPNRGVADIRIDGVSRAPIDLYSAQIEWQTRQEFCCLAPGRHLAVIAVTGRKNANSSGVFVDVDSFIVW